MAGGGRRVSQERIAARDVLACAGVSDATFIHATRSNVALWRLNLLDNGFVYIYS